MKISWDYAYALMEAVRTTTIKPRHAIGPDWDIERNKEVAKFLDYGVVIVTDRDPSAGTLDMMWVYTDKTPVDGGKNLKARLCARVILRVMAPPKY